MYHDKIKAGLSLTKECMELLDKGREELKFRSKNELAEEAIRFYIAYHNSLKHTDFLSKNIYNATVSAAHKTENRIAKIAFKTAVECAMFNLITIDLLDLSEEQIKKYRKKAVALLNETHEFLSLDRAKKIQSRRNLA